MYEKCTCPDGEFCHKYQIAVNWRQHQYLRGDSGLPRAKEEFYISVLLGQPAPAAVPVIANRPEPPPEPGLLRKMVNFAGAVVKHVAGGMQIIPPEQSAARLDVCATCEMKSPAGWVCRHQGCGCNLQVKAAWKDQDCPLGKWPKLELPVVH